MGFGSLLGCGAQPPSYEDAVAGRVELAPADREAFERLAAGVSTPARIRLYGAGEALGSVPSVRIEGGRITGVKLNGVRDAGSLGQLDELREVRLAGSFDTVALSGLGAVESLDLISRERHLEKLVLSDLPRLKSLRVSGAALEDLDLAAVPLERLVLDDSGTLDLARLPSATLQELQLLRTRPSDLGALAPLRELRTLGLVDLDLTTLSRLPPLASLRSLSLAGNPLRETAELQAASFPELEHLELRRTGLRSVPPGLALRDELRVALDDGLAEGQEFEEVLRRLRESAGSTGELVTSLGGTSGRIERRAGQCRWKTGALRRAEVSCRLTLGSVSGTARVELGTTDPALPFQGGGYPRVRVRLSVEEGELALYLPVELDLIQTARAITDFPKADAEAFRQPGDDFKGFRRVVARSGEPAEIEGDLGLIGPTVFLVLESVGESVQGVSLEVDPQ